MGTKATLIAARSMLQMKETAEVRPIITKGLLVSEVEDDGEAARSPKNENFDDGDDGRVVEF